jgi:hypothetical protein
MPVGLTSRYRNLQTLAVTHRTRGRTLSLPIRREEASYAEAPGGRLHRVKAFESHDLLALRAYGREDLYWVLLDGNGRRMPEEFVPGEEMVIPPAERATRVKRSR